MFKAAGRHVRWANAAAAAPVVRWTSSRVMALPPMSNTQSPEEIRQNWTKAAFPVQKLTALLDHDNHEMRNNFRKFLSEKNMIPK